jgi:hypothetical protein
MGQQEPPVNRALSAVEPGRRPRLTRAFAAQMSAAHVIDAGAKACYLSYGDPGSHLASLSDALCRLS